MAIAPVALLIVLAFIGPAVALEPSDDVADDAALNWLLSFGWETEPGLYVVPDANAEFALSADEVGLFGPEAGRFAVESEGVESFRDTDAVILKVEGPLADSMITITHLSLGYVRDDDWGQLDPDDLLQAVRESTSNDNVERIAKGIAPIEILGWVQPPTFDAPRKIASWAIKAKSEDQYIINASALKLARDGFTRITWIGDPNQFLDAKSALHPTLERYDYQQGWRYADFRAGDALAGIGIATLTRQVVTGRTGKAVATAVGAGLMAVVLAFAKKLWFLIFLPFFALWRYVRNRTRS